MEAAKQFLSLVRGELPLLIVLGLSDFTEGKIEQEIEAGLKFFLKACQPSRLKRSCMLGEARGRF